MVNRFGCQSMVGRLRRVVVRRPDRAFGNADPAIWHYAASPDLEEAQKEHGQFVSILADANVEICYHDEPLPDHADSIFVHDPVIVSDRGAIVLRMGKLLRRGEEDAIGRCLGKYGVPIHYRLSGDALAEGGDLLWLDSNTLAVGLGYRTNLEGFRQLGEALPGIELIPVQLPYYYGPDACLHLMSLISVVDVDLAVVYRTLLPVIFLEELTRRGFNLIDVPDNEFQTMGPNVLAIAPRQCVMLKGNMATRKGLESSGCTVQTYKGDQISLIAEGGATCLTRPIWRN